MTFYRTSSAALVSMGLSIAASAEPLTVDTVKGLFSSAQQVSDPVEVDCTLSAGAETTCIQFTVVPAPTTYEAGP